MEKTLTKSQLTSYGVLAMPLAFAGIPLYIHAPDYYTTSYGVSLTTLGFILLSLRMIDAVQDPIIGYLSDIYSHHQSIIMLASSALLVISFVLLFTPHNGNYLLWFGACIFVATTAFSILTINLNALGGMWSKDKHHKTTIASYRECFHLLGLILAVTLPSILQNQLGKETAFIWVSAVLAIILPLCLVFFMKWYKAQPKRSPHSHSRISLSTIRNIPTITKQLYWVYGISALASSIPAVLILFFVRDRLGLEAYSGVFLLTYFLSGAFGIALWQRVSIDVGKYKTWLIAMVVAVCSFMWAYFLVHGDMWQFIVICLASGLAFGAQLTLPPSILADHIHHHHNESMATSYFSILTFLNKLTLALAAASTLPMLDFFGFIPNHENSPVALSALSFSYAILPCSIQLFAILLLRRLINAQDSKNPTNRRNYYA